MKKFTVKKFVALMLGFALMFAGSAVFAAGKSKTSPEDLFKKLDSNSDDKLSLEEFKTSPLAKKNAEATFKKWDTDNDGFLSLDEFKAGLAAAKDKKGKTDPKNP